MPQTPQYEQRTSAQGPLGPGPQGDRGAGALVAAGRAIADDQQRLADFQEMQAEQSALVSANEELQGARSLWSEELTRRKQEAPAGAAGFTQSTLKDFDKDAKERIARAKTQRSREQLRARLADVRLSLQEDSQGFELSSGMKDRAERLDTSIESARTAVNFRPRDYDKINSEVMVAIAGSGLTDEQRVGAMHNAGQAIAAAAVAGMIRENPRAALAELNNEKSTSNAIQGLGLDERQRARSMAQSEINRLEAEARASRVEAQNLLRTDADDAFAARALGLPSVLPPRSRYLAAFGKEGGERHAHDQRRMVIFDVAGEAAYQAPQEATKTLEKLKPVAQAGAAEGAQNYASAVQIYNRQRAALEANPVETLEARDPQLLAAHQAAAANPDQVPAYFSMLRARQQALGIAEPKLLPEAKRAEIANALVFDLAAPRRRVETVMALRQAYGDEYVNVMQEVAPKLDGMGRVIVGMDVSEASRLDAAFVQKDSLAKAVPEKLRTEIDEGVRTALTDFNSTLADQPDGPDRYAEHFEATKLYAQSLVNAGASPEEAARAAADAVINRQYTFRDGLRIPAPLDDDQVARSLDRNKTELATKGTFVIDTLQFSTPEAAQEDMRALIARSGYWITNETGTGVVLRIPHRSGQGEVYRTDGTRVGYTWEQLAVDAPLQNPLADFPQAQIK